MLANGQRWLAMQFDLLAIKCPTPNKKQAFFPFPLSIPPAPQGGRLEPAWNLLPALHFIICRVCMRSLRSHVAEHTHNSSARASPARPPADSASNLVMATFPASTRSAMFDGEHDALRGGLLALFWAQEGQPRVRPSIGWLLSSPRRAARLGAPSSPMDHLTSARSVARLETSTRTLQGL